MDNYLKMHKIHLFNVAPAIPEKISFLETLANNMWWCWNLDALELFRRINPQLIRQSGYNPLKFLNLIPQERLESLAEDDGFLRQMETVKARFEEETKGGVIGGECSTAGDCTAYFSLEYGIHESVKIYSGGLGILAGDHLKTASCMNIPLVGVGLLYRLGYFQQYLNETGWQQEHYPENELNLMPLTQVCDDHGKPLLITLPLPEGPLKIAIWKLPVGRVPLFLLDANIVENNHHFRELTAQLYGGDRQMRLRQELILGIGGFRALLAMGYHPAVCHMNEGHAAFLSLARLNYLTREKGLDFAAAYEVVSRTNVFTTHTPLPAGNEVFEVDLLRPHLRALAEDLGIAPDKVIEWGLPPGGEKHEMSMTVFGLRMAQQANGVSRLHGQVARNMWADLWPGHSRDEVPIDSITNGVHVPSWLCQEMATLFDRFLGPDWRHRPNEVAERIDEVPDEELWRARETVRGRLIRSARELLERQLSNRNAPLSEVSQAKNVLDHDALTIGFARRFATYKRATLLLRDPDRLIALLKNDHRPVQLIFSGKAHPHDDEGKEFIRQIVEFARSAEVHRHIVFLENYDMNIGRRMVQGADVWLNMPRRPQEASGTSGMKAALNGGLHLSVLDGWWAEGYTRERGWAIGDGVIDEDPEFQDMVESQALYNLLENEVVPCFYERQSDYLPSRWTAMMKASIKMGLLDFTSHRMLEEYNQKFYSPARQEYEKLLADNGKRAKELIKQRQRLEKLWKSVRVAMPSSDHESANFYVGDSFKVTTQVHLGELKPEEVDVELYYGPVGSSNKILTSHVKIMEMQKEQGEGNYEYVYELTCETTGRYGFTARVTPRGHDWKKVTPGFIVWAEEGE